MTLGSLFSGIGGFELGFERAGFTTLWQVEIDPWARRVLEKNFPHAERFSDIRDCGRNNLKPVDVICGGFPCQDISNAGLRAGIEGERSGLVTEAIRIIDELRPRVVLLENVAALLGRGLAAVLGYLAEIGYDAEWEVISAADVGAPHLRERVWILAYPNLSRLEEREVIAGVSGGTNGSPAGQATVANGALCDTAGEGLSDWPGLSTARSGAQPQPERSDWWLTEPSVGRVAHGVPARVDRLRGLGNAVVPQIPELYARKLAALLGDGA